MENEEKPVETEEAPEEFPASEEVTEYVEFAETEEEPIYTLEFIQQTICTGELEAMTINEFGACSSYYDSQATIGFGNIIIGVILGFLVVKGLFETWR